MKEKSILLQILFWCEMIIAARVLVFTMPVMFNAYSNGSFSLAGTEGQTILTLTMIALFYFMTGLASIMGFRSWKLFHYLGTALTFMLSIALIKRVIEINGAVGASYYIPVVISVILSIFITVYKDSSQRSAQSPAKA